MQTEQQKIEQLAQETGLSAVHAAKLLSMYNGNINSALAEYHEKRGTGKEFYAQWLAEIEAYNQADAELAKKVAVTYNTSDHSAFTTPNATVQPSLTATKSIETAIIQIIQVVTDAFIKAGYQVTPVITGSGAQGMIVSKGEHATAFVSTKAEADNSIVTYVAPIVTPATSAKAEETAQFTHNTLMLHHAATRASAPEVRQSYHLQAPEEIILMITQLMASLGTKGKNNPRITFSLRDQLNIFDNSAMPTKGILDSLTNSRTGNATTNAILYP